VVEFKGWQNGYGNFVIIRHNKTYETAYGHCSRFGNISVGNRVRQGQIIAYVGMTGGATGPHLHYEVRQNEVQVNPVAKQFNLANGLTGKQLAAFKANKQSAIKELASLSNPTATKTADATPAKPAKPTKLASR
jgi:murein DD-endopeptidase MepM/ murein hydrolase activator NlpD